jgi:CheY-like chemotaxis protein
MALLKIEPSGPLHTDIQEIMNAARRSADLVRQLLAFARKQTIAPKTLDINNTVADMLNMLRKLIGEDIDLLWKPALNLWPVKMDPTQIDQLLANLAVNARDSISRVGKITIETGKAEFNEAYCSQHAGFIPGKFALLAVSDNGCGMDKETCEKIFEPFFTTKEVGKGTGMGLATVYGIVKQNSGFVNVYSEPGTGTTFRIYLPRHGEEVPAIDKPRAQAKPLNGTETVLLVEDDEALLKMGKMMLEELGYAVLIAGSPNEAIKLVGQYAGDIHLLVTDVVMPEMSGRDLQKRLSALRPDMKYLFMSGYTANVIAHRGILDEGVNFIQKPFHMEELAIKVREAMGE